jgi:thiamine monophosphate kinase
MNAITIAPGVYTCANPVTITGSITLSGNATDVWVFQFAQTLTQSAATQVNLTGGALAKNVFWQVAGNVDIGTTALMQGVILGQTLINLQTGATENGRLLAQTAVTIDQATVTIP